MTPAGGRRPPRFSRRREGARRRGRTYASERRVCRCRSDTRGSRQQPLQPVVEVRYWRSSSQTAASNRLTRWPSVSQERYRSAFILRPLHRIELSGFRRLIRDGVVVRLGQTVAVDFALEIGGLTEEVRVTAATTLLQPANADSLRIGCLLISRPPFSSAPGRSARQSASLYPAKVRGRGRGCCARSLPALPAWVSTPMSPFAGRHYPPGLAPGAT